MSNTLPALPTCEQSHVWGEDALDLDRFTFLTLLYQTPPARWLCLPILATVRHLRVGLKGVRKPSRYLSRSRYIKHTPLYPKMGFRQ